MLDLLVVYSPLGGGHRAAANAIVSEAQRLGYQAESLDLFQYAPTWARDLYTSAHLTGQSYVPNFFGNLYFSTNRVGGGLEPLRHVTERRLFGPLVHVVEEKRPRVIVSTHHLPSVVLGPERTEHRLEIPLVSVVTDYSVHGFWVEPGIDLHCVATTEARDELLRHGVPHEKIAVTGIPVRREFEQIALVDDLRGRPLRVLVTTGGFGVGPMRTILRSFEGLEDIELTFICGANGRLRVELLREAEKRGISANILGFEANMPARFAEADVVVGKAGGLTVTEAMTAGRALVLVGSVPGNETLNETLVLREEAGVRAEANRVGAAILSMRQQARSLGARGRAFVAKGAALSITARALRLAGAKREVA